MPCPFSAGFNKSGGVVATQQHVIECLAAAKLRGKELRGLLRQALDQASTES